MSYFIDIIDTVSPQNQLVYELASASGITLEWSGGDTKDEMDIVGSHLQFDMLTKSGLDAAFINFFTGDEKRFLVLVKKSSNDEVLWRGHIVPDLYSEPYQKPMFVSFTASDGLGRLKGKYLPDDYYTREKSVIDIFCQILKLTDHDLDLYFNPAIENFLNKNWNTIYIDTDTFHKKGKKQDAYKIFSTLLQDTLCICYQADNRWYIEGINTRQVRKVNYKIYNSNGIEMGNLDYTRLLKDITALVTPTITILPPYNEITITHAKVEPSLPKTLCNEINDGWAVVTGVVGKITASDWMGNGGLYVWCEKSDYECIVYHQYYFDGDIITVDPQDDTRFVSLKQKLFIAKSQKIKFDFKFNLKKLTETFVPENISVWNNIFKYEIVFNDVVLFSNFGGLVTNQEDIIFSKNGEAKLKLENIFTEDGFLDLRIYGPPGSILNHGILGIELSKLEIVDVAFKDEQIITDVINGEFTIDKDVELIYADDKTGMSKGFRLSKLKETSLFFNEIQVPILYGFTLNSKFYAVVQLVGANLIDDNRFSVFKDGLLVTVIDVYYNFNDGEQMAVQTPVLYNSGNFTVKKYAIDAVLASRSHWTQWTDAIYKIENTSYAKTVSNIYRRMFNAASEKLDLSVLNAVKFNDVILFRFVFMKDFFVLNCSWNLDENATTLTLARSTYKNATSVIGADDNIPPIVLAGENIFLTENQTTTSLLAIAYDPDGTVVSQQWTKIAGPFGDIINTPFSLATTLQNLTADFYSYQIQVTDNQGATGLDSLNIIRIRDYTVTLNYMSTGVDLDNNNIDSYQLVFSPALLPGVVVKVNATNFADAMADVDLGYAAGAGYSIIKNSVNIETDLFYYAGNVTPISFNFILGDVVFIHLIANASSPHAPGSGAGDGNATATSNLNLNEVLIIEGQGSFLGLPITISKTATA